MMSRRLSSKEGGDLAGQGVAPGHGSAPGPMQRGGEQ
jgi:hypothetical protein